MRNHTGPLRQSGPFSRSRTAVVAVATGALTMLGLGSPVPATSAVDGSCPAAFPVADLADGQQVHGLTVSKGTTPEPFTGEVLGVIEDGIAPDLDMVIARLTSPEIDRVGGIWQGMSGSPVYAADGRLIGAVSYGLSFGASPVAGITPAADMEELLSATPGSASSTTARASGADNTVAVPRSLQREMTARVGTSGAEASSGLDRLPLPLGISGMVTAKRLNKAAKVLDLDGVRVYKAGAVSASAAPTDIVAGGNLAASMSYGDLSVLGVGTATAVCGEEVLAFGHPMNFSGPSTLSMHGATAVFVQEESLGAPFKVANAGAPVGSIVQDRLAGLLGVSGAVPDTTDITSFVEVPGEKSRTGTTHISVPDAVPDLSAFHLLTDQDRIFDGISGGRAAVGWTVTGTRADGRTFVFVRNDRFANNFDLSFEPVFDLLDQLFRLQNNGVEQISIDTIKTRSIMRRDFQAYSFKHVQVRSAGTWHNLARNRVLRVRPGSTQHFRVLLTSAQLPDKMVPLSLTVPRRAAGRFGFLQFTGGNSFFGFEGDFGEGPSAKSFGEVLSQLTTAPRNDEVLMNLSLFARRNASLDRSARAQAGAVVDGDFGTNIRVVRPRRR